MTTYYAAAQTTASGVSRPTRLPEMDGPQRSTIAEAVRDYGAGYEWQVRAMEKDGRITPRRLHRGAHPYYVRAEVELAMGLNEMANRSHGTNGGRK